LLKPAGAASVFVRKIPLSNLFSNFGFPVKEESQGDPSNVRAAPPKTQRNICTNTNTTPHTVDVRS